MCNLIEYLRKKSYLKFLRERKIFLDTSWIFMGFYKFVIFLLLFCKLLLLKFCFVYIIVKMFCQYESRCLLYLYNSALNFNVLYLKKNKNHLLLNKDFQTIQITTFMKNIKMHLFSKMA